MGKPARSAIGATALRVEAAQPRLVKHGRRRSPLQRRHRLRAQVRRGYREQEMSKGTQLEPTLRRPNLVRRKGRACRCRGATPAHTRIVPLIHPGSAPKPRRKRYTTAYPNIKRREWGGQESRRGGEPRGGKGGGWTRADRAGERARGHRVRMEGRNNTIHIHILLPV